MYFVTGRNANEVVYQSFKALEEDGQIIGSRAGTTKEIIGFNAEIKNPIDRLCTLKKRGNNVFATIAETLWVLSGSTEISYLLPFLPRAAEYSDDGINWRAGYGKRLRSWFGMDQILETIKVLEKSPGSRQAQIVIWDPAADLNPEKPTKDIPCTSVLNYRVDQDNRLHAFTRMRSNDCVFGYSGINIFEFTLLQEIIALCCNFGMGNYYHQVVSFHAYEPHFEKLKNVIENNNLSELQKDETIPFRLERNSYLMSSSQIYSEIVGQCKDFLEVVKLLTTTPDDIDITHENCERIMNDRLKKAWSIANIKFLLRDHSTNFEVYPIAALLFLAKEKYTVSVRNDEGKIKNFTVDSVDHSKEFVKLAQSYLHKADNINKAITNSTFYKNTFENEPTI